jgi:hypothetical protein
MGLPEFDDEHDGKCTGILRRFGHRVKGRQIYIWDHHLDDIRIIVLTVMRARGDITRMTNEIVCDCFVIVFDCSNCLDGMGVSTCVYNPSDS